MITIPAIVSQFNITWKPV